MIQQHRDAIAALARRHGVRRLDVFGSALRDDFDPAASDVDFVVEFEPSEALSPADQYFGLLFALEDLLRRPVDLVCLSAIANPYFAAAVRRQRQVVYAA